MKERSLKQRLVSAVLALVMMIGALVSTTYAWFTDSVTSAGNKIVSGSLKVDLELLDKESGEWISLKESKDPIFNYTNWEPGYVDAKILKVENEGSLALKWKAKFVAEEELSILADVIDVYVKAFGVLADDSTVAYPADRALEGYTKVGTLKEFVNTVEETTYGNLLAGQAAYLGIALKMQESAGNDYQDKELGEFDIQIVATQLTSESDSFGDDYDKDAAFPDMKDYDVVVEVPVVNGAVSETTTEGNVTVPAGVKVNTNKLGATVKEKTASESNVTPGENEIMRPLDVHVEGVAEDNEVALIIALGEVMPKGLNIGNYTLYHLEDGVNKTMTAVADKAQLDAHNEFYYDPVTGEVWVAMATFSEVAIVADTVNAWEGNFDYSWYDAAKTELTIANADQLAAFGAIVGGMKKVTGRVDGKYTYSDEIIKDSFFGKTVKLIADINLGDKEYENNPNIIFYPIGYWNNEGTYERKPLEERTTAVDSALRNFEGIFDGNGNTIENFYQNTWEMKGDHNWYSAITEQYYRDGMGLFGRLYKATVKNLTVKNFSCDSEIGTSGSIAAYADGATFENIAIFNCNPRVYNIGNGGIVGCVGWYAKEAGLTTTFKNITVDNSNKISALWGTYDAACGGIVGQYYPTSGQTSAGKPANGGMHFENCHVAAQIDVYNDVCANYQYYAYRYAGILIGSVRENVTIDGHSYPKMDDITAKDCTVHFGDWNDYYYCELVANSLASYTHDHQMSRLTQIEKINVDTMKYLPLGAEDVDKNWVEIPTSGRVNYVVVKAKNDKGMWIHGDGHNYAECYHFVNGAQHFHDKADADNPEIYETVNGVNVLKEDKQLVYREFNNLVTGYGWGVTSKGLTDFEGVENMDITEGNHEKSVEKFEGKVTELANNKTYKLGDIFTFVDKGVKLVPGALTVSIANKAENNPVSATIVYDRENWENGTITLTGIGNVKITITDYYFCTPTTITVNVTERQSEEKFDLVFPNTDKYLYRVGNVGSVAFDKLFKAKDSVTVGTVSVTVEAVNGSSASGTYSNNAIQFNGTGVVKVTITDNHYCIPTELYLEVVDATNVTGLSGTLSGNVVLLNDCGLSSLTVSGRNTVYGNGFTATYTDNGQYLNNGLKQGVITVSENGTLDNLRIVAPIYPSAFMYYGSTMLGEYVQQVSNPYDVGANGNRYYYQLSAVVAKGNATIQNCYIYGGRTNIFVDTGDVTVKDTILECGTVANMQIQSNASHTITLENLTTIQYQVNATVGDTSKVMLGAGIVVGPETTANPTIVLNGEFKQYNWVTKEDADAVSSGSVTEKIINGALDAKDYNHTINGETASNLGIIYMNDFGVEVRNNTGLPYEEGNVTISALGTSINGKAYSLKGASADQIYSDYVNADKTTVNGLYQPQFKYPADLGGQHIAEGGDEHCFREGDTIKVLFPSGDTKVIDLAALVNITKYTGQDLGLFVTVKDSNGNDITVTDGKVSLSAADTYTVTYTVTDTVFYDQDGNAVSNSITYSWNVTIDVSLKDTALPNAYFDFVAVNQKMGYYVKSSLFSTSVYQYIPFLAGLKIYDYNGQDSYLRFDGDDNAFNKVASITVTNKYSGNDALVVVKLTDGGTITLQLCARADSGGGSTYTGSIKTSNNIIYFVNDGTTNENPDKGYTTTTNAYWYIDYYKFTGNNGVEITSGQQKFTSTGSSASTPSGSFSTSIKYTVTYDANGGNCGQTTGYATSAAAAVTLPTPTRSGYIFAGWYTAASGGTRVGGAGESYTPSANITLYAQWGKPCTVTYDANGGSCGTTSEKYTGTALTLPTPTRDGYWFIGWYDAAEGGNKIGGAGEKYNPANEITLYAHWQEKVEYTVTYNANGGSGGTANATYQGTALILPTPTRTGYTFNGWYTAASGGTKIGDAGASYTPSANITLYAQWKINSYTITVTTSNATITGVTNGQKVEHGTELTITVKYDKNSDKKTTVNGNKVTLSNNKYTFTVTGDTTIHAESSDSCVTSDTLVMLADGTQKRIDQVTTDDMLLVWNFYTGDYDVVPAAIIFYHGDELYDVVKLYFEDGTTVKVINNHGFYDAELDKFIFLDETNADEYIGHKFVKVDGDGRTEVALVGYEVVQEYTGCYSIQTAVHINFMVEGMFSLTIPPMEGWFDYFEIGEGMKYDEEKMQADIELYGLYTYEDFAEYVTYEQFIAFNGPYLKVLVGRGVLTYEQIIELIAIYVNP